MALSCGVRDLGTIVIISIVCLMLISMVLIIRKMAKYYLKLRNEQKSFASSCKIPFYLVTILTTLVVLVLIIYIPYLSHACYIYQSIWSGPYMLLYIWQFYFLILFWLYRLYSVFQGTVIPLSKCTVISYIILYTITILFASGYSIAYAINALNAATFARLSGIIIVVYLIGSTAISILFASKLIRLHKSFASNFGKFDTNNDKDESLLVTVSKLSILTWLSLIITFIQSIALPVRFVLFPNSILMEYIGHLVSIIDPYTNFVCIILSYKHFQNTYLKICCIHSCCFHCWMKCANVTVDVVEMTEAQELTPRGSQKNIQETHDTP